MNLNRFNGVLTDSNEVNALGWQYIYATVYSSRIYGTNTLPTPEANYTTFNNAAKANKGVNPVSMLALSYSSLKPDAVTNKIAGPAYSASNRVRQIFFSILRFI